MEIGFICKHVNRVLLHDLQNSYWKYIVWVRVQDNKEAIVLLLDVSNPKIQK